MQQAGGMSSKMQLVDAYITAEAANFELFNQVAGINAQAAELQDLIVQQQVTVGRLRSVHSLCILVVSSACQSCSASGNHRYQHTNVAVM